MKASRRTKNKIGSAAHIKRNTEGTSNEISFSVLDAAKMEFEGQIKRPEIGGGLGRISLFTLSGRRKTHETPTRTEELPLSSSAQSSLPMTTQTRSVQVDSPDRKESAKQAKAAARAAKKKERRERAERMAFSPEYEIARRKGRRRLHRVAAALFVVIATVAIVGVAGTALFNVYKANEGSVSSLQDALANISAADETLVSLDGIVNDPVNPDNEETVATLAKDLPAAREELAAAYSAIEAAFGDIVNPRDREAASNALGSVDARISMVDFGVPIVEESSAALSARASAVAAWNDIMAADSLAREAASLANESTVESITESKARTEEAIDALNEASYLIATAQKAYPAADLSAFSDYIAKRIEALNHAIASDDAFLAEDTTTALSENEAYNNADAQAAELAASLPTSVESVIEEAFEGEMTDEIAAYEEARSRAASTDAFLRTYRDAE